MFMKIVLNMTPEAVYKPATMVSCAAKCFFRTILIRPMPKSMLRTAAKLYIGPVGRAPGKKANNATVFTSAIETPTATPKRRKAVTIGISQIWYIKYGAYGAGIFIGDRLRAIAKAAKTTVAARVFVFKVPHVVLAERYELSLYLRVATH
jgi:hypothetical protein